MYLLDIYFISSINLLAIYLGKYLLKFSKILQIFWIFFKNQNSVGTHSRTW